MSKSQVYNAGLVPNDVFRIAINYFINRTPLLCRFPKLPTGSPQFQLVNDSYRPRSITLDNGGPMYLHGITIAVSDASVLTSGDVIQVEQEYMLVEHVEPLTNLVVVTRGYAGTTAASHNDLLPIFLVSPSEPKAEVSPIPQATTQFCQTVQHAYKVGAYSHAGLELVSDRDTPLDRDRMLALRDVVDRFETDCYYGTGINPVLSTVPIPLMRGIQSILTTNNVTRPVNAHAYTPKDLIRDTLQPCFNGGGNPNLLVVSTDMLTAFAIWGHAAMRVNAGTNVFGESIDLFEAPFLAGISIVPAPLLRPGTAICLSAHEARIRLKRPLIDKRRETKNGAEEGDMIIEGAIEIDTEQHHAMVSGITAYSVN